MRKGEFPFAPCLLMLTASVLLARIHTTGSLFLQPFYGLSYTTGCSGSQVPYSRPWDLSASTSSQAKSLFYTYVLIEFTLN